MRSQRALSTMRNLRAAFVRGEAEPAGDDNDAAWLLRFYNTFLADANEYDVTQAALNSLATLRGNFAFILYDAGGACNQHDCRVVPSASLHHLV